MEQITTVREALESAAQWFKGSEDREANMATRILVGPVFTNEPPCVTLLNNNESVFSMATLPDAIRACGSEILTLEEARNLREALDDMIEGR